MAAGGGADLRLAATSVVSLLLLISSRSSSFSTSSHRRRLLLLAPPSPPSGSGPLCTSAAVASLAPAERCAFAVSHCPGDLLNYAAVHFCRLSGDTRRSLPLLLPHLLLLFRVLAAAAGSHFSPAVARLSARLRLSPTMAAVTLLALGNGAPDAFASSAALRAGQPRTGLAAILSAGAFVSAFVVGCVALRAAPFPLRPGPFVRDATAYLLAVSTLFYIYLSAEIYLWQAVGFVGFYIGFVFLVLRMDMGTQSSDGDLAPGIPIHTTVEMIPNKECIMEGGWGFQRTTEKIAQLWEAPIRILLKLTVPSSSPSEWNRFYSSANIVLCPLAVLYWLSSFISLNYKIVLLFPLFKVPIWSVVLFVHCTIAVAHFLVVTEPPGTENITTSLVAFIMSVFWISTTAGELLNCLVAIGVIVDLPPAILGLTVLAWGNSVGDLVADVALAKAGQPATAVAGCFVGPMFNMLVGLGSALVIETGKVYPEAYELRFHISIVVAFVFLLLSLMGSLLVVTWHSFRFPRFWGFCLVGLYLLFTAASLFIVKAS